MAKTFLDVPPSPNMPVEMGTLLATLEDGSREWREELGEISPEGLVWQPFPGGHSVGAVLLHIAEVEYFWIKEICMGEKTPPELQEIWMSEQTKQYEVSWPTPPAKPLSWYLEQLDFVRAETRIALTRMPDHQGVVGWESWDYESTRRWVLAHVVEHDSYHGGQAVLLKLLWERLM